MRYSKSKWRNKNYFYTVCAFVSNIISKLAGKLDTVFNF